MDFHNIPIDELSVDGCKLLLQSLDEETDKEDIEYLKRCIEIKEG